MTKVKSFDELKKTIQPDPEIIDLREQVKSLKRSIRKLESDEGVLRNKFDSILDAVSPLKEHKNIYKPIAPNPKIASPVTAVAHFTDWHVGKNQRPDEIEGLGECDWDLIQSRILEQFVPQFIKQIEAQRTHSTVEEGVIFCTGDLINGELHLDDTATNDFPVPVQIVNCGELLARAISNMAAHFKKLRVEFVVADNHSRRRKKPQSAEEGLNSDNYVVGHLAKKLLQNHPNVEFNIYPMLSKVIQAQNMRYLVSHGHEIDFWMGIPYYGIERKIGREARVRQNIDRLRFDKILIGHLHVPIFSREWSIGGSVSGTTSYDHKAGRHSEPAQTMWFVHPKHGEYNFTPLYLR